MSRTREQLRAEIAQLLAETPSAALARETEAFTRNLEGTDGTVVLFGAGRLGRLCARALRRGAIPLRAICDRNPALGGTTVEGVPVLRPEEAAARFGAQALFVVAIWTGTARESMVERLAWLRQLGAAHVTTYAPLVWAHGREETPFHAFDLPSRVLAARGAWQELAASLGDVVSLETLRDALQQRLRAEFAGRSPAADQYFPADVYALLADGEAAVDGGAFTGDTLAEFVRRTSGRFASYDAFEPSQANGSKLRETLKSLPASVQTNVRVHAAALAAKGGTASFDGGAGASAGFASTGEETVATVALDHALGATPVTWLKLDVEGAELEALAGADSLLRRVQPLAAICVYHGPEDLWRVPERLRATLSEHCFYLRQHGWDGWETVCYAVPRGRAFVAEDLA